MNSLKFRFSGDHIFLNEKLVSACGLYCGACGIFLATQENDAEKLLQYAIVLNQPFDETLCDGCRANRKSGHCKNMCSFIKCTSDKGIEFCGTCSDYPCKELLGFQSTMPHRLEILESQDLLKEIGRENWLVKMNEKFSCPRCNTINSAYDVSCRRCGNTPGCEFVALHKDIIDRHLSLE
jgi:hypothetical protein